MAKKKVATTAWGSHTGGWEGVLIDVEGTQKVWSCEHNHPDDIEAEFCALDKLLEFPVASDEAEEDEDFEG